MSAYMELATPMTIRECLLDALADAGFPIAMIEVHQSPSLLMGYPGDRIRQSAEIIIRRQNLSGASADLGFVRTDTGYRLLVNDMDRSRFGPAWLGRVSTRYEHHRQDREQRLAAEERRRLDEERRKLVEAQRLLVVETAKKQGYRVQEVREGEAVRLVLTKRVY
jgi:hypothetical protein